MATWLEKLLHWYVTGRQCGSLKFYPAEENKCACKELTYVDQTLIYLINFTIEMNTF